MEQRDPIRAVHWGLGPVGLAMAHLVWRRPGLMPCGAMCAMPEHRGRDLGEALGLGVRLGVPIAGEPGPVLDTACPDVTLIAAGSGLEECAPQVIRAMEAGSNVICVAAEMAYPWATHPEVAERLDDQAHAYGVAVLGLSEVTALDTLALALTGCCLEVEGLRVRSGAGSTHSERHPSAAEQSVHLLADGLGWRLDRVEHGVPAAGMAVGYVEGAPRVWVEGAPGPSPEEAGATIAVEGTPGLQATIRPDPGGVQGTAALAVNLIPAVLRTGPGLKTVAQLPVARAVLGDVREVLMFQGPTVEEELARGWHMPELEGPGKQERL